MLYLDFFIILYRVLAEAVNAAVCTTCVGFIFICAFSIRL